jgi:nitrogen fixation protein NifU and related proteins
MSQLDDLYREVVLEHHRNPSGRASLDHIDAQAEGKNPSCGDECTIRLAFDGDRIAGVQVSGQGCVISTASGSILAELVQGQTATQAAKFGEAFRALLKGGRHQSSDAPKELDLGDLEALAGVRQFPLRVKCAMLPWATLDEALRAHAPEGRLTQVTTETREDRKGAPS